MFLLSYGSIPAKPLNDNIYNLNKSSATIYDEIQVNPHTAYDTTQFRALVA